MPKCKYCGAELSKKTAYVIDCGVTKTGRASRRYYCSQEEYEESERIKEEIERKKEKDRQDKNAVYAELRRYFPMIKRDNNLPTVLYADMNGINEVHGWDGILEYLQSDREYLEKVMNKEFPSYNSRALYLLKVIMTRIEKTRTEQPAPVIIKQTEEFIMSEPTVQTKKKTPQRRGFDDLLEEL